MNNITALYKNSFIEAVILANKELYTYINTNLSLNDYEYTNTIGFGGDNSLKIDLIAENIFIKHLEKFGNIYSEECGLKTTDKDFTIIIDPLDGSNNFYSQLPYYGTSVALQYNGDTICGFVTNLVSGIIKYRAFDDEIKYFSIIKNKYFTPINILKTKISIFEKAYAYPKVASLLSKNGIKFRSLGAVALSLSEATNYDFVLYYGIIRDFDVLAALYICKDLYIYKNDNILIVSSNKEKFNLIKEVINQ